MRVRKRMHNKEQEDVWPWHKSWTYKSENVSTCKLIFCFLFFVHLISVLEVKLIYTVTWNGYINSWIQHRSLIVFLLLLLSFKWIQLFDKTKTTKYKILFTVTFPDVSWRKVNFGGARILTELFVPEGEEDWKLQLIYTSLKKHIKQRRGI